MNQYLNNAKKLLFFVLGIDIVFNLIAGFNSYSLLTKLQNIQQNLIQIDQSILDGSTHSVQIFTNITILTMFGVGLAIVRWLNASYQFAKTELSATGFKYEGWTTLGWIVPLWNMFRPYQIINEIFKAGSPHWSGKEGWKKESYSGLLLTWWVLWIFTHLIVLIVSKELVKESTNNIEPTLANVLTNLTILTGFCIFSVVISLLWYVIVGNLTQRLIGRTAKLESKPNAISGKIQTPILQPTITKNTLPTSQNIAKSEPANIQPIASHINMNINEDHLYEIVANELDSGNTQKGLWTKLFAQCNGDETQTKVRYIEQRVRQLMEAEKAQQATQLVQQQMVAAEQQRLHAIQLKANQEQLLEAEHQRLQNKLIPPMYKLMAEIESNRETDSYSLNDESKFEFIRLLGGVVTLTRNWAGEPTYSIKLNAKNITFKLRSEFNDWFFNVLLPNEKSTEETFPLDKLQLMEQHGITYDGKKYHYKDYQSDKFSDVLRYAEKVALEQS